MSAVRYALSAMGIEALKAAAASPSTLATRFDISTADAITEIRNEMEFRRRNPRFRRR